MKRFSLADALLLGALALLFVAVKSVFRFKLGLTGHSMFFVMTTFLLARGLVPVRGSVIYCGLMVGLLAMIMGMGKGGPLVLLKFMMPAVALEFALLFLPNAPWRFITAWAVAFVGVLGWALKGAIEMWLVGAAWELIAVKALWKTGGGTLFAGLACLMVPKLLRHLAHHQLIGEHRVPSWVRKGALV
ncbi:core component of ECF transporter [Ferrimonas pelagia]|uniref:Core component of ECF transporter n=1 Tax=Ferrimonas pelagia TaxID=1177826 RepID=A0ABP9FFU2_9GAMM